MIMIKVYFLELSDSHKKFFPERKEGGKHTTLQRKPLLRKMRFLGFEV